MTESSMKTLNPAVARVLKRLHYLGEFQVSCSNVDRAQAGTGKASLRKASPPRAARRTSHNPETTSTGPPTHPR